MDYEKLGVFYLGRPYDPQAGAPRPDPWLYPSKHLTTHAVCVGMTGSGKTGLSVALLEEAAIDGIPAVVIDPKGDLANLLLTFPDLRGADFLPWVDPADAARKGLTPEALAEKTATTWRDGLAQWGQAPDRIARFRDAVEITVYTPGSKAGAPMALLRSFAAPPADTDEETLRERISAAAGGLLGLVGIDADPLQSREHVFLSRLLGDAWAEGRDLDLAALILAVQKPGFDRVGVMDLESFYPAKERFGLAMALNNLLASPGAAAWMEGAPLDFGALLHTPAGKPRISILSIAHLSDAQRMFFVSAVLGEAVAWMRSQSGTSSLRALLFMDEIQGFFPPVANPPSKPPMLTLLKQARAFGLGVVLATQNPVDLDYKGLSNCGTWFVGRLQTERDKARLMDGLEGAAASGGKALDRAALDRQLSGLGNRVFLVNDVHADEPVLVQTRWALSYLAGPITREQIKKLQPPRVAEPTGAAAPRERASAADAGSRGDGSSSRPLPPPGTEEVYLAAAGTPAYRAGVYVRARLHYVDKKLGLDHWAEANAVVVPDADALNVDWSGADVVDPDDVSREPAEGARYGTIPALLTRKNAPAEWKKTAAAWLFAERPLTLGWHEGLKLAARPDEAPGAFAARLAFAAREARDAEVEKLNDKYAAKLARADEKLRRAQAKVEQQAAQAQAATVNTALSFGATIFGAFFGKKALSASNVSKASSSVRAAGRTMQERQDVDQAKADLAAAEAERAALQAELTDAMVRIQEAWDPTSITAEEVKVAPRKSDIGVDVAALAWVG